MPADDLFGGDGFSVPPSVAAALDQMGVNRNSPVAPLPATLLEAYEREQAVAAAGLASTEEPEPEGVWLTFELVQDGEDTWFTEVGLHRSELEALRTAVGKSTLTARFLPYGERLEDVL